MPHFSSYLLIDVKSHFINLLNTVLPSLGRTNRFERQGHLQTHPTFPQCRGGGGCPAAHYRVSGIRCLPAEVC